MEYQNEGTKGEQRLRHIRRTVQNYHRRQKKKDKRNGTFKRNEGSRTLK